MLTVSQILADRPYPGRGCLAARAADGILCFVYFLTGRSPASRARQPLPLDNGDIAIRDTGGGVEDDALRYYTAAARRGDWLVLGNGDHVVPMAEALAAGVSAAQAWQQHTFEPDLPIYTPRIWLGRDTASSGCLLGYVRRSTRGDGDADRVLWSIGAVPAGSGVLMTTYDTAAATAPVRTAQWPVDVRVTSETADELLAEVWSALDGTMRVAAFCLTPDRQEAPPAIVR